MGFITFDGLNLHYECEGEGPPLLFLHGLGADCGQSRVTLSGVRGVSRILMDIRGHGESALGPENRLTFRQFAQDALALMDHLGFQQFIAGGISMGSGVALTLALAHPTRVSALILIRPAWLNVPYPENLEEHVMVGRLLARLSPEEAKRSFRQSREYRELEVCAPAVARSLAGQFDSPGAKERVARLIRIPASVPFSSPSDLWRIRAQTLIICTDRDPAHPLSLAQRLSSLIAESRCIQIVSKSEDAERHLRECAECVNDFVCRVTRRNAAVGNPMSRKESEQ